MRLWAQRSFIHRLHYKRKEQKRGWATKYLILVILFLATCYLSILFEKNIKPIVMSIAETKAKLIATQAINEAINEKIITDHLKYEDLISFQKNKDGQITALESNIVKMNQLKADMSISVQQRIAQIDTAEMSVPIGNILNNQLLSGWGPRIPIKLVPLGNMQADFKSTFEAAGINQTKHQIDLVITGKVSLLLPIASSSAEVITTVPVAQTIIVGNVPNSFIHVEGTTSQPQDAALNLLK